MRCACKRCHNQWRGDQREFNRYGLHMHAFTAAQDARLYDEVGDVDCADALEAAVACDECRHLHCEALMTTPAPTRRPRIVKRRKPFDPNSDSQQVKPEDGEGAE